MTRECTWCRRYVTIGRTPLSLRHAVKDVFEKPGKSQPKQGLRLDKGQLLGLELKGGHPARHLGSHRALMVGERLQVSIMHLRINA